MKNLLLNLYQILLVLTIFNELVKVKQTTTSLMHSVTNERDKLLHAKNVSIQLANILIFLKAGADRCSKGHNSSGYTLGLVNNNTSHHRESKIKRIGELYFCYSERKLSFPSYR